ncbi:MAG: hypothetical protein RSF33_02725 [Hydrogenoanaerobacterium sp.]
MEVWMYDAQQAFLNLLCDELSYENAQCFCDCMCTGDYEASLPSMDAEHLVFIYGDQDKNYTSDEVTYLQLASTVILFASVSNPDNLVFFVDLLADADEANIVACAIIKLLNKAFHAKNIFCFRLDQTLAFGCMKADGTPANHFFISEWGSAESAQDIQGILDNCVGSHLQLMDEIAACSVLERWNNPFDTYDYNPEYVLTLQELMSFYPVDLNYMIEQYKDEFCRPPAHEYRYKEFSSILREIGELELTSYEFLEKANKAKEIIDLRPLTEQTEISFEDLEMLKKIQLIPTDTLNNPVKMLEIV